MAGAARLLLEHEADIEALDGRNQGSPIHFAARWGRLAIAEILLQGQENGNGAPGTGLIA